MKAQSKADHHPLPNLPAEVLSKIFCYMLVQTRPLRISNAPQERIYHGAVEFWRAKTSGLAKSEFLEHNIFQIKNKTIFLETLRALLETNVIVVGGTYSPGMSSEALRALLGSNSIARGGTDDCNINSEALRALFESIDSKRPGNDTDVRGTYSPNIDSSAYTRETRGYFRHLSQIYDESLSWVAHISH